MAAKSSSESSSQSTQMVKPMDMKTAKQAIESLVQQKSDIDGLLAGLCGGSAGLCGGSQATLPPMAKSPAGASGSDPYAPFVGKAIGIRTVTFSQVGRLVEVHPQELVLEDAACIMDWGRFAGGATGSVSEVEPFPIGRVVVGRGAIVDCFLFGGKLPLAQK